ncbi:MRPL35 [Cordylochernes scorpioides]|uniref:Large ribosomal subunit protein bL35m n=1 Tax=Cordylochernes scorpioides TaxID=51811 RepID=A0ABY6K0J6_9ARAC|nr:MRPL35 [Cordylochernes scorpioides]
MSQSFRSVVLRTVKVTKKKKKKEKNGEGRSLKTETYKISFQRKESITLQSRNVLSAFKTIPAAKTLLTNYISKSKSIANNFGTYALNKSALLPTGLKTNYVAPLSIANNYFAKIQCANFNSSKFPTDIPETRTPYPNHSEVPNRFSMKDGRNENFNTIILRMKRLNSGIWIRPRSGRHHRLWKKSGAMKYRLRQHVFVNKTQSRLLDKMVTKYWKTPKYYIDEYEPYQQRHNINIAKQRWGTWHDEK